MNFSISIVIEGDRLVSLAFGDVAQPVPLGAALQAVDAARAALLNVPVAQPEPPSSDLPKPPA